MTNRTERLAHSPEEWSSRNIHEVAKYYFDHPEDKGINVFLNLFPIDGTEAYNKPLVIFLRRWYLKQKSSGGYILYLGSEVDEAAVFSEVVLFLVSEHRQYWDPEKFEFLKWIVVNLRQHSRIGNRLCKTWRQFKGAEKFEYAYSSETVFPKEYSGEIPGEEKTVSSCSRDLEIRYLAGEYGLTEMEVFLLITEQEFGKAHVKMLEYVNSFLPDRKKFGSRRELKKELEKCRKKATKALK